MSGIFSDEEQRPIGGQPGQGSDSYNAPSATESEADKLVATEQQRSERQRIEAIQKQLQLETTSRNRGFGLRALLSGFGGGARSSLLGSG